MESFEKIMSENNDHEKEPPLFPTFHGSPPALGPSKILGVLFGLIAVLLAILADSKGYNSKMSNPILKKDYNNENLEPFIPVDDPMPAQAFLIELHENDFIGPLNSPQENTTPIIVASNETETKKITLKRGNTLMQLVIRAGAKRQGAYDAITSIETKLNTRKLQIGQEIEAVFEHIEGNSNPQLTTLSIKTGFDTKVVASRDKSGDFSTTTEVIPNLTVKMYAKSAINDSLFLSAKRAGVPAEIIAELIRIFSFDVDFQREIRKGDLFKVYFNRFVSEETGEINNGTILYASLTLRGEEKSFYNFTPQENGTKGRNDFFNKDGQSARRSLMKTPVDGARLSSSFGQRKHPVLGYTRMHKGVDFAVYTGTPIMAAGDGIIERSSSYGSYGNYIRIRHNDTYKTSYAHLSRYGKNIKQGRRVKQGQIIGYSGATGRVSGAHLHYEVLMNGNQVNPMTLKLPTGKELEGRNLEVFSQNLELLNQDMQKISFLIEQN